MKIYLAGGMRGPWRHQYKRLNDRGLEIEFYDPSEHRLTSSEQYTMWDLAAIDACDSLVGFMEADNPSGQGLTLEIGYAKALGKKIILVLEEEFTMQDRFRYFLMAVACADMVTIPRDEKHEDALDLIRTLCMIM